MFPKLYYALLQQILTWTALSPHPYLDHDQVLQAVSSRPDVYPAQTSLGPTLEAFHNWLGPVVAVACAPLMVRPAGAQ